MADPAPTPEQAWAIAQGQAAQNLPSHIARQLAEQQARGAVALHNAKIPPSLSGSLTTLYQQMSLQPPDPDWSVERMALRGHLVTLPSARKTGKTTFLANLNHCAVDGELFLDRFACKLDGRIAVFNNEMEPYDHTLAYRQLQTHNTHRIVPIDAKGYSIPFLRSDAFAEWLATWLRWAEAEWWELDPWKDVCRWNGVNPNDGAEVAALVGRIRDIQVEAGVNLVVISAHITQAGTLAGAAEGSERAKGAGEFEDSADSMWRYFRAEPRREAPRLLYVEGRGGTGLDETTVEFNPLTCRLTLGEGGREQARDNAAAMRVVNALRADALQRSGEHPGLPVTWTTNQAEAVVGGNATNVGAAMEAALRLGLLDVARAEGRGRPHIWRLAT